MKTDFFFIGIGGISMSSLSIFAKEQGYSVAGSDICENECVQLVRNKGIHCYIGHDKKNVENVNCIIYNSAIHENNPEYIRAKELGIPIISRAEFLGKIASGYENVIAISGTHGKTTTVALLAEIFEMAGKKPTVHIGGFLKKFNSNFLLGEKEFFITEACEYKDNFLSLSPDVSIILNVENDHMDYFKNYQRLLSSFNKFAAQSRKVFCYENVEIECDNIVSFGMKGNKSNVPSSSIRNIHRNKIGFTFDYEENGEIKFSFQTKIKGKHNLKNIVASIAVSRNYNISFCIIQRVLLNFHGVKRRNELIGSYNGAAVIHDYAHHPTEIKSIIDAYEDSNKRKIVIFQPHTFSRTKALFCDFVKVLEKAEFILLYETYSAREDESEGLSAFDLYLALKEKKQNCFYFKEYEEVKAYFNKIVEANDIILILGAGDIDKLATFLVE